MNKELKFIYDYCSERQNKINVLLKDFGDSINTDIIKMLVAESRAYRQIQQIILENSEEQI